MTSKRTAKAIIHEACDIIECGVSSWSCHAITRYGLMDADSSSALQAIQVRNDYAAFYAKDPTETWGFEDVLHPHWQARQERGESRSARIIAMLLFLEAEGDV